MAGDDSEGPKRPYRGKPGSGRPSGERPQGGQSPGGRPYRDRAYGDRPYGKRPSGGRPPGAPPGGPGSIGGHPRGGPPYAPRPRSRPGGPRPDGPRPDDDRDRYQPRTQGDQPSRPGPAGPGRPLEEGLVTSSTRTVRLRGVASAAAVRVRRAVRGIAPERVGARAWQGPERAAPPRAPLGPAPAEVLGEDEEIVAGRRPVEEAFAAHREAKRLLVVPERRTALDRLVLHATTLRIPVVEVEGGTITAVAGFDGHQGVALVVAPRRWSTLDEVLALAKVRGEPPLVLVLDHLEDPQNVGTLLRSAEACGVHGVLFPMHGAAPISPAAIKTSAGAVEHLLLVPLPITAPWWTCIPAAYASSVLTVTPP